MAPHGCPEWLQRSVAEPRCVIDARCAKGRPGDLAIRPAAAAPPAARLADEHAARRICCTPVSLRAASQRLSDCSIASGGAAVCVSRILHLRRRLDPASGSLPSSANQQACLTHKHLYKIAGRMLVEHGSSGASQTSSSSQGMAFCSAARHRCVLRSSLAPKMVSCFRHSNVC